MVALKNSLLVCLLVGIGTTGLLAILEDSPTEDESTMFRNAGAETEWLPEQRVKFDQLRAERLGASMGSASGLTVLRRLSLGLTGTVPSLEEIRLFESLPEEASIGIWASRLMQDRRFASYFAERFARAFVGVENGPFLVFRRRRMLDWLADEILQNRPYDQLVRKIITSEGIWTSDPEVNFVTVTVDQNNEEEGPDEVKLAARVSRAFLGVRLDCVQCHDDMFGDRWKQEDFHQLASFFAGTEMSLTGVRDKGKPYKFRYKWEKEEKIVPSLVPFRRDLFPETGTPRERLAGWVTHPENRAFANAAVNRVWAILFNRPLTEQVDDIPLDGSLPAEMVFKSDDFIANGFDLHRLLRIIVSSKVFAAESRDSDKKYENVVEGGSLQGDVFPITHLRPEQIAGSLIQCSSIKTIDRESHHLKRFIRLIQVGEFVDRFGDFGEEEFRDHGGTISQRLLMMNGKLVHERTKEDLVMNASTRLAILSAGHESAIENAFLAVLTRRPSDAEREHFLSELDGLAKKDRAAFMEDLYWILINSTEFSWNH